MSTMFVEEDGRMIRVSDAKGGKEEKETMYMLPNWDLIPMSEYLASKDKKWVKNQEKQQKKDEVNEEKKAIKGDETPNFDEDQVKKLLDDAWVKYHHMCKLPKLLSIAKDNDLL